MLRCQRRWARFVAIIASAMKYLALPLAETSIPKPKGFEPYTKYRLPVPSGSSLAKVRCVKCSGTNDSLRKLVDV